MSETSRGDRIHLEIGGGVSGQVAAGRNIAQHYVSSGDRAPITEADLEQLRGLVTELKEQVAAQAPPEQRDAALERIDELHEAVVAEEPDLTTMEYVRSWFVRNLPKLAGAVTGLLVNPLIGGIVGTAGELVAADFHRRFTAGGT